MMHHSDPADREVFRQHAHGHPRCTPQEVEDPPSGRMPQGIEHLGHVIEGLGGIVRGAHMSK